MSNAFDFQDFVNKILLLDLNTVQMKIILCLASEADNQKKSVGEIETIIGKKSSIIKREIKKLPIIDDFIMHHYNNNEIYIYILNRSFIVGFDKSINKKDNDVSFVFEYWKKVFNSPKSKLDSTRFTKIKKAIDSFGVENCKLAIDGCSKTLWNMGIDEKTGEESGKVFIGVDLIFRNAEKTERFIRNSKLPVIEEQIKKLKGNDDWAQRRLSSFDEIVDNKKIEEEKKVSGFLGDYRE